MKKGMLIFSAVIALLLVSCGTSMFSDTVPEVNKIAETSQVDSKKVEYAENADKEVKINHSRPTGQPLLKKGSEGDEVSWLQVALNYTMFAGLDVNGKFDEKTDFKVREFQTRCGLVVDGVVGPNTIDKLVKILSGEEKMPEAVITETIATQPAIQKETQEVLRIETKSAQSQEINYVINHNSMKFHHWSCAEVKRIKEENREDRKCTRESLISEGYSPCGKCNP